MKRHAKAPSAAPTASRASRGSGSPVRSRTGGALIVAALSALLLGLVLAATSAFAAPATVTIDPVTGISYGSAKASGHINPGEEVDFYFFAYRTNPGEEFTLAFGPPVEGSGNVPVSADLTGLKPGTEYEVLLGAYNKQGEYAESSIVTFTTKALDPPVVSINDPSSVTGTSAHFSGTINPKAGAADPDASDIDWHFVCTPECPGLSGGHIDAAPSDDTDYEVSANATGLKPHTDYEVSLIAKNVAWTISAGPKTFSTPIVLPQISELKVDPLSTEAELESTINPGGATTTYHFEYGPTESYGQSTATRTMPAGTSPVPVSANLFGLTPASGYHFRLVASNSAGTVESPDQTFTTKPTDAEIPACPNDVIRTQQGSQRLPDCRAFERVSPADNAGVPVYLGNSLGFRATADGNKVIYVPNRGTYPGGAANPWQPKAVATRTNDDWLTETIDKPTSRAAAEPGTLFRTILAVSRDMSRMVVISSLSLGGQGVDGNGNLYIYDDNTGKYTLVMTEPPPAVGSSLLQQLAGTIHNHWIGGSSDLSTIAFEYGEPAQVYVWSVSGGLRSLGVGGGIVAAKAYGNVRLGAVSDDGSRIYYQDASGAVALDENGTKTVVSISRRAGDPPDPVEAFPEAASPDGRYLIFSSPSPLTEGAPSSSGSNLYRYDAEADDIEYLAHLAGTGVNPEGILRAWPERKEAYVRIGGYPAGDKLYHLHDGELTLVAADYVVRPGFPPMSASPNGRYVVFANEGTGELELYDGETEVLSSIGGGSFGPAESSFDNYSSRAVTDDGTVFFDTAAPRVPTDVNGTTDVYAYRDGRFSLISPGSQPFPASFAEVTPSGRDVFFTTEQRLVASDIDAATDVYDARIGGGLASQNVTPIPPCSGDACRGATPAAPEGLNAATETLHGRENPRAGAAKRCGKGQQRQKRKGKSRCVKQHKRNAKQGKQSHNRSQGR